MDSGVEVHRLGPESEAAARRAMWIVVGGVYLFLLLILAVVGFSLQTIVPLFWWLFPSTALLFASVAVLGNRASAREHAAFGIAIGPDVIRMVSTQFPVVEMVRDQVVRVDEFPGGLRVYAEGPPRVLFVPRKLEGYPRIREMVAAWKPPQIRTSRKADAVITLGGTLLGVIAFSVAIMSPDGWLLNLTSAMFLGLSAFAAWRFVRERYLDPKARRAVLVALGTGTAILAFRWAIPVLRWVSR